MDLALDLTDRSVRSASLYQALRDALGDGRLKAGDRLPASRELAKDLGISRNTVATVYERLVAEGFCESRVGAGTYVAETTRQRRDTNPGSLRPRPSWQWAPRPTSAEAAVPAYDLRVPSSTSRTRTARASWRTTTTASSGSPSAPWGRCMPSTTRAG
ncbi:winged helix-turn-helix domain-containing protein [Nocardioides sp. NPDC047086]|uniref:winged helix-turn-helix domain-containing protein n=1 Tax=Nocardioides sp. NPDC047086 TaxID=3154810 RepID=UPI0033F9B8C3